MGLIFLGWRSITEGVCYQELTRSAKMLTIFQIPGTITIRSFYVHSHFLVSYVSLAFSSIISSHLRNIQEFLCERFASPLFSGYYSYTLPRHDDSLFPTFISLSPFVFYLSVSHLCCLQRHSLVDAIAYVNFLSML